MTACGLHSSSDKGELAELESPLEAEFLLSAEPKCELFRIRRLELEESTQIHRSKATGRVSETVVIALGVNLLSHEYVSWLHLTLS